MITIRPEEPADFAAVREIIEGAFGQTSEASIVDALRLACSNSVSLVAVEDGTILGHIFFSPAFVIGGQEITQGMGLAPMAVVPGRQRQGIGSKLVLAPDGWVALLGLVPLLLGISKLTTLRRHTAIGIADADEHQIHYKEHIADRRLHSRILSVAAVTIANGGDNLGVYIPLFAGTRMELQSTLWYSRVRVARGRS